MFTIHHLSQIEDAAKLVIADLEHQGRSLFRVGDPLSASDKTSRVCIAPFVEDGTRYAMVGIEGAGCAFFTEGDRINKFTLIEQGANIFAAEVIEGLLSMVAVGYQNEAQRRAIEHRIEHQKEGS